MPETAPKATGGLSLAGARRWLSNHAAISIAGLVVTVVLGLAGLWQANAQRQDATAAADRAAEQRQLEDQRRAAELQRAEERQAEARRIAEAQAERAAAERTRKRLQSLALAAHRTLLTSLTVFASRIDKHRAEGMDASREQGALGKAKQLQRRARSAILASEFSKALRLISLGHKALDIACPFNDTSCAVAPPPPPPGPS